MTVRLADHLIASRRRRFVGRSPQLAQLHSALKADELPFQSASQPDCRAPTFIPYLRAFPDLRLEAEEIVIQGDSAALSWILNGIRRASLLNIPATGRAVRVRGLSMMTMADGRIKRTCLVWNLAGLLRTLGLLPELA